jgi:hypothetical protein
MIEARSFGLLRVGTLDHRDAGREVLSERVGRLVEAKHEHLIRERQTSTPQGATWNKGR